MSRTLSAEPLRQGEVATDPPEAFEAGLVFIGRIETPWIRRQDCPRQGDLSGPDCRLVLDPPWDRALQGIEAATHLDVLYWLDLSRRDLLVQNPHGAGVLRGSLALRSPVRPNPIGLSRVCLMRREGSVLVVRGLDCVSGTPLLDVKPARCPEA